MEMNDVSFIYRLTITLFIFSLASYYDIKKREVNDLIWLIYVALTLPIAFIIGDEWNLLIAFIPCFIFGAILYYVFKFGGADAKAIWCLAIALPSSPYETIFVKPLIFPLSIAFNAVIISIFYVFVNIHNNIKKYVKDKKLFDQSLSIKVKIMLFLFSKKLSKDEYFRNNFYIPSLINGKYNLKQDIREIDYNKKEYITDWYEKAQPFLVYVLIAIPITIIFGDLSMSFVSMFMKH